MKNVLILVAVLISITFLNCGPKCCCTNVDVRMQLVFQNSAGKNLIQIGRLDSSNVKLFTTENGLLIPAKNTEYLFSKDSTSEKSLSIFATEKMILDLNGDKDTITTEIEKSDCGIYLRKVIYNDKPLSYDNKKGHYYIIMKD